MIIYNTTFLVMDAVRDDFLAWVRTVYVPRATQGRMLVAPTLARVMGSAEDGAESYALQFRAHSAESLQEWKEAIGEVLIADMTRRFGNAVMGFSTMMAKIEL